MRGATRVLVAAIAACLLAWACAPGPTQSGGSAASEAEQEEQDRQSVIEAHRALQRAYEQGDPEAFAAGLDSSPELLVFHPMLYNRFDGIDEVRTEMSRMFARIGQAKWSDVHPVVVVEGDAAWLTSQVVIEAPNLDPPFVGRGTEIYVRRPEGWRLTHAHWSANPESD